ncbi:MAG TPA: winged helix-turn-helix domain-containing protein [Rhizomicrobium sp.]|jgi:DNA-binding winged helix-turn-helix (wHTH) protein/tetratricopeptide (TPR) repeat protein|nr:winged helix-turn-helix domain-containing protein [Rhizomicrobium sp.]
MTKPVVLQKNPVYRFGGFELQPGERRLSRDGNPVALTPKALDTLLLLVERAGHVISKDELMHVLWPGRFVTEANLTKHVWTLRKTLGESEQGGRYIETVSKTGYRFVAPVSRTDGAPQGTASAPIASAAEAESAPQAAAKAPDIARKNDEKQWVPRAAVAVVLLILAAGALVVWPQWRNRTAMPAGPEGESGASVAIVDFNNLSRNPKDAWIGPAFEEMLGTDLALGGRLHTMPDELVRPARDDLPVPGAGGYAMASLALLHQRLGTDYVVSGSYLAYGGGDNPPLRLDLALQDARRGVTIATVSRTGTVAELPSLITVAGAQLRQDMGAGAQSPNELKLAANAEPPNADVMRRVGFALDALHRYDPARARDELLQAIAEAPGYAPAYALLAKAWSNLGYAKKALAAAEQAAAHSTDLPASMRLQIEIQRDEARFDWPRAIEGLRQLALVQRGDPEAQLDLIDALLAAGKPDEAANVLARLRSLGDPVRGDPRFELAAVNVSNARGDAAGRRTHAARALELAKAKDAPGLAADAELQLGVALSYDDQGRAEDALRRALAAYRRIGNPRGEAKAHLNLGNLYSTNDPRHAREEYQLSLALYESIGDQNGIAAAYSDLGIMLWNSGDRDGAETAARNVLQIRRMTGDIAGQAWALTALAGVQSDEAASDAASAGFLQAAALDASIGNHGHRGYSLFSLSDILRLRGALADAQATCAAAQSEYAKVNDPQNSSLADFECAQIALDRGDVVGAETELMHLRTVAVRKADSFALATADLTLAKIRIGNKEWLKAASYLDSASKEYARNEMMAGETVALSLQALCDLTLGKPKERDAAMAQARALRSRITERQEVIAADIALAEVRGEAGEAEQAVQQLREFADDARRRQWQGPALEADLAAMRVLARSGDIAHAKALRARITATAHRLGFGWVLQRLQHS